MAQNDFLPFAAGVGANVLSQSAWVAASARTGGFSTGIASSAALNKAWRQSSIIAAAVAQLIADTSGATVIDDGTTATIEADLAATVKLLSAQSSFPLRPYGDNSTAGASTAYVDRAVGQVGGYYQDTGSTTNAYVIALIPAVTAYDHSFSFRFRTTRANTGAATLNFGAGAIALKTESGAALAAGDISTGSIVSVTYDAALGYAVVNELVPSQLGTLAKENIGQGLEDDGAANLRVKLADGSMRRTAAGIQTNNPVAVVAASQAVAAASHGGTLLVSAANVTLTAPTAASLWNGYDVTVIARGGAVTFQPNAADKVNGGTAGAPFTILTNQTVNFVCDGAGNWWPLFQTTPQGAYSPQYITTAQTLGAGTYWVDTSAGAFTVTLPGSPAVGTVLEFSDATGSWGGAPLTLARNGATILGSATDLICDVSGENFKIWFNGTDWRLQ